MPISTVGKLGHRGEVSFLNALGNVHVLADLVGYFDEIAAQGVIPVAPRRLLDTRLPASPTGGAPLGEAATLDLQVAGRDGVAADASGVVLNITVAAPTHHSFLTLWPAGEEMPLASSANMRPDQTVANQVFARVGAGGRVNIFQAVGATHVIVDLLGWVPAAGGARFVSLLPDRLLDTRNGIGAPVAEVNAAQPLRLQVAGRGGVPPNASAALLNLTAVAPSRPTHLTLYPSDVAAPEASNVNVVPGEIVPNSVVAKLGPDGAVMIRNGLGRIHVVADVMGYFVG